jgi:hypothetical protein
MYAYICTYIRPIFCMQVINRRENSLQKQDSLLEKRIADMMCVYVHRNMHVHMYKRHIKIFFIF